ncbi:hypothetical protein [Phyllobacterium sp. SB3]|uniref:hypothetical protein n=1 Tax=Phyllobacterium sp. SB3 TaxID=3156073 RepID=UPI0032AF1FBD
MCNAIMEKRDPVTLHVTDFVQLLLKGTPWCLTNRALLLLVPGLLVVTSAEVL